MVDGVVVAAVGVTFPHPRDTDGDAAGVAPDALIVQLGVSLRGRGLCTVAMTVDALTSLLTDALDGVHNQDHLLGLALVEVHAGDAGHAETLVGCLRT